MVPLASLLNPMPPSVESIRDDPSSAFKEPKQCSPSLGPPKKQKMSKAAATFVKGKPKGEVNYPPYEIQDEATAAELEKFEVQPIGRIGEYPKRIPYNSEKKTFQQKTGMDGFEVYQYTFRMPNDARDKDAHTVMWDYNVGLVRITAFFKSLRHTKTMPAKVMNANPGLREISHSITGGSIAAQGYWVPFEAAKAIAATFCYQIRYVLVPVFGPDFVSMCQICEDSSSPDLSVHSSIIQRCTETATANQAQSRESSVAVSPRTVVWPRKSPGPKPVKTIDVESGYGTDSDRSEGYLGSPGSPGSIEWTPVNTPKVPCLETYRFLQQPPRNVTSNPRGSQNPSSSRSKRMNYTKRVISDTEDASGVDDPLGHSSIYTPTSPKRRKISPAMTPEIGAAYTLMELNVADANTGERKLLKRRRASA